MNRNNRPLVNPCNRKSRLTDVQANNSIAQAKKAGLSHRKYHCTHCASYHVTSLSIHETDVGEYRSEAAKKMLVQLKEQQERA